MFDKMPQREVVPTFSKVWYEIYNAMKLEQIVGMAYF